MVHDTNIYSDGTYLRRNPTWHMEDAFWKAAHIRSMLARHSLCPSTVGEVGCGSGEILRVLAKDEPHVQYFGFDVSPDAFRISTAKAASNISFQCLDVTETDVCLDVMLCIDVIEHVEDYIGFARKLRRTAHWKLFHIPLELNVSTILRDAMMSSRSSAGHLHYFTRKTAIATLMDAGYEVVDVRYTKLWIGLPSRKWKASLARVPRALLYYFSPDLCVRLLGGCSLLVLAK